jgi:hypothetical protein
MNVEPSLTPPPIPIVTDHQEAQRVRRAHLSREASVQSVGTLYCVGGVALMALPLIGFFNSAHRLGPAQIAVSVALACIGILQFWTGTGLRKLKEWARKPTAVLSGLGLINFPIGTLINAYVLYLVFSQKGTTVFSPEYRNVISSTPDIKYRTSVIVWILLGVLVLLLMLIVLAAVLKG